MSSLEPSGHETITIQHAPSPAVSPVPLLSDQAIVDVRAVASSHANVVIIGEPLAVRGVLTTVWPFLKKSVRWVKGTHLLLPVEPGGTLIVEKGDRLNESDQTVLLGWLNDGGRTVRVLTTSARPLFPLVEAGLFLDSLYYRLNHVLIEVGSSLG